MNKAIGLLALGLMILTTSCKVTFTRSLRAQIEDQGLNLKKIQYYNSQPIVLKRVLSKSETTVTSGEVRLENGLNVEQIEIKKNTPGVLDSIAGEVMYIRFEQGPNRYIKFSDNAYGQYEMKAERWDPKSVGAQTNQGYAQFFELNKGEVMYEGKKYYTNTTLSKAKLKIKKKETSKVAVKRRRASGVRVN